MVWEGSIESQQKFDFFCSDIMPYFSVLISWIVKQIQTIIIINFFNQLNLHSHCQVITLLFSVISFFNNRSENIRKIKKIISICISFNIYFFFGCGYLLCWKISQFLCGCLCLCISCAATRMGRDDGGNLIDEYCCPDVNVCDQAYNSQDAWTMYLCKWIPKARIKHPTLFFAGL